MNFGPITVGCMSLGIERGNEWNAGRFVPDKATGIAWVRRAHRELGLKHFDTAQGYGRGLSEEWLGEALAELPRDQVIVTTKVGKPIDDAHPHAFCRSNIRAVCDQALRRLRTDHLDYLMFHNLRFGDYVDEALDTMAELIAEGKIRAYAACPIDPIPAVCETFPRLHPGHWHTHGGPLWHKPDDPGLAAAKQRDEPVVIFAPYLYGLLTGRWGRGNMGDLLSSRHATNGKWKHPWFSPPSGHGLYTARHDPERTLTAIDSVKDEFAVDETGFRSLLLRYILRLPGVASVCPGFSRWEHLAEAASAVSERPLTEAERNRFSELLFDAGR